MRPGPPFELCYRKIIARPLSILLLYILAARGRFMLSLSHVCLPSLRLRFSSPGGCLSLRSFHFSLSSSCFGPFLGRSVRAPFGTNPLTFGRSVKFVTRSQFVDAEQQNI